MSLKFSVLIPVALLAATPVMAQDTVIISPERVQAGNVVITEEGIEAPGVSIRTGSVPSSAATTTPMPTQTHGQHHRPQQAPAAAMGSDFTNAELNGMDFRNRSLRNAVFVNATLVGANFENADLRGADFTNAELSQANLNGANLEGANLTNVTLNGAHMFKTNLNNANLTNADMNGVIRTGASLDVKPAAEIKRALSVTDGVKPAKIDLTVNFDFDSDNLTQQGREQIAQIATALGGMGSVKILVQGHTDNVGSDAYNQSLSDRRAQSVVRELKTIHRVTGADLIAKGYGEAEPVATNETDLGRAQNRRVTLVNVTKLR